MSKLPILKPREVVAAVKKAGFIKTHQTGSHKHFKHPKSGRRTTVPIHPTDVKRGTLRQIIGQTGLTREQFLDLL